MGFGKWMGYADIPCPNCGRIRVELYENGKRVCEKCMWCIEDGEYVNKETLYADMNKPIYFYCLGEE